jgi:hypothetical protein
MEPKAASKWYTLDDRFPAGAVLVGYSELGEDRQQLPCPKLCITCIYLPPHHIFLPMTVPATAYRH